jgi:hypothetical protein
MHWFLTIFLLSSLMGAQQKQTPEMVQEKTHSPAPILEDRLRSQILDILKKVEQGIRGGNLREFEGDLGTMISLSIVTDERGYFSTNQAFSVLSKYFSSRRPISFKFSKIYEKGSTPYATGRYMYVQKGNQESAQIYIALTRLESRWVISQFNIY